MRRKLGVVVAGAQCRRHARSLRSRSARKETVFLASRSERIDVGFCERSFREISERFVAKIRRHTGDT